MHTPGPWTRDDDEIGFEFTVGSGDKCFQAIATIHEPSLYHTTDGIMAKEANACLIIAAPDLLAALRNLVRVTNDALTGNYDEDETRDALSDGQVALAKVGKE